MANSTATDIEQTVYTLEQGDAVLVGTEFLPLG